MSKKDIERDFDTLFRVMLCMFAPTMATAIDVLEEEGEQPEEMSFVQSGVRDIDGRTFEYELVLTIREPAADASVVDADEQQLAFDFVAKKTN